MVFIFRSARKAPHSVCPVSSKVGRQRQPKPWKIRMKNSPRHFWRSAFNWLWMWNIKASRRAPSSSHATHGLGCFFWGADGWLENWESLGDLRYSRGKRFWNWPFSSWKFLYNLPDGHWGLLNVSGSKMQFFRIGEGADNPDGDAEREGLVSHSQLGTMETDIFTNLPKDQMKTPL